MLNTLEIAELVRLSTPKQSKYAASKVLGITPQRVDNWYHRGQVMSDEIALKAASELELPHEYVLACLQAERTNGKPSHGFWVKIAEKLTPQESGNDD